MLILIAVFVVGGIVDQFGNPEKEQGLIPQHWDSSRIAPFAAFAFVVVVVAPIVEELQFRGVGYGLLERFGPTAAILARRARVRARPRADRGLPGHPGVRDRPRLPPLEDGQHLPCMLLHASFNAFGLIVGIAS